MYHTLCTPTACILKHFHMDTHTHTHTHTHTYTHTNSSYNRGAQDAWSSAHLVTDVFYDPLSSSGYPMITYTNPVASNLPIKPLVARQLQAHTHAHTWTHTCRARPMKVIKYRALVEPVYECEPQRLKTLTSNTVCTCGFCLLA